jgi:hypothetical protein
MFIFDIPPPPYENCLSFFAFALSSFLKPVHGVAKEENGILGDGKEVFYQAKSFCVTDIPCIDFGVRYLRNCFRPLRKGIGIRV